MAEGFFRKYAPRGYMTVSVGTRPVGEINPIVVQVMKEYGIDISKQKPKKDNYRRYAVVNVHFKGVYFLTQKLLPLINDGGRIVNISSGLTRVSFPGGSAYAATKGAIEVLTCYLAKEMGPRRITANVVAPGPVQTDFSGGMVRDNPEINKQVSAMTALGRSGPAG
jgi:NAD(P)-dependent dehydrogenase (short-subunit alcohol dehydrogenase family)